MNTSNLKITIIGNSVALRVRPPKRYPNNQNYSQKLEKKLAKEIPNKNIYVINKAFGAATVTNIIERLDEFIRTFPYFYIINIGVVDASTREIPLWFYRITNNKKNNLVNRTADLIYRAAIIKLRPQLVKLRGKRSWTSKRKFERNFDYLFKSLIKETNAKIIVLAINPANSRVETQLPGSLQNHQKYNGIMKRITEEHGQTFIDLNDLKSEKFYPDGVHYSEEGHEKISGKITEVVLKQLKIK